MVLHLRTAGRAVSRLAAPSWARRPAAIAVAAGSLALVAGLALLAVNLAPLFGLGGDNVTVSLPAPDESTSVSVGSAVGDSGLGAAVGSATNIARSPLVLDRPVNGVAFTMSVPAIGYKATVLEGVGNNVLMHGPGHYPTSAWPGERGNVAIAAHNVYWLGFSRLKAGNQVEIQTRRGLYVYEITGSKVIDPSDTSVLAPTQENRLTMTTCWPLWAGAYATQRLVFTATEIGGVN